MVNKKKTAKVQSNNNSDLLLTKNNTKPNTIEAAFRRITDLRQCPICKKKLNNSIYQQHYEQCKIVDNDDDVIFCGEQNNNENTTITVVKKNLTEKRRSEKSSAIISSDITTNSEVQVNSLHSSVIVSRDIFDSYTRRASPITISDDSNDATIEKTVKDKNFCYDLSITQVYEFCVERLDNLLTEQEELLRNHPPPKCNSNRPLDLTDENDSLMDPPPLLEENNNFTPIHYSLRFVWIILQKTLHCIKNGHENVLETANKFWGNSLRRVHSFLICSVLAQQLFTRLLMRRRGFHIAKNIRYHDLGPKLMPLFIELCDNGFFEEAFSIDENGDPNSSNITIDEAFNLLQVDDFKVICKKFHIDTRIGRQGIIRELKKHAIRKDVFGRCNMKHLLNCIKQLTGKCYRIRQDILYFFNSFFTVYAPNLMDVGAIAVRPHQCYVDLCAQLIYIKAKYDEQQLVCLIDKSLFEEAKDFALKLKDLFFEEFLSGDNARIFEFINLPIYLRKFTAPWVYCRCIFRGVEEVQKLRDYKLAVNLLMFLIQKEEFKHFCINSRGKWYKRLALNLNKHLKRDEEAAIFCALGIDDPLILVSDKLSLQQRLDKLSKHFNSIHLLEKRLILIEPEKVFITGLTLGKGLGDGINVNHFYIPSSSTFTQQPPPQPFINENNLTELNTTLSSSSETSCSSLISNNQPLTELSSQTILPSTNQLINKEINKCNVEEIALNYFIENENFKEGVFAEGKIWHMLFRFFFWDIISFNEFEDSLASNVWISWMQNDPLDLNYSAFYDNRRNLIDERLKKILNSKSECILYKTSTESYSTSTGSPQRKSPRKSFICTCFIHSTVERFYNDKYAKIMENSAKKSTIDWHDFEGGKDQFLRFLHCCSPSLLHSLFNKLCTNFRNNRSGFPDLTIWNFEEQKLTVVEVKGPNDKLSTKQQLWLDFFKSNGVRAVVCHVLG
ncbi:Fanconi-associated nuclease [Meloidogyne graminicola]|uniref:Fanconi-associated nuclease n=1 Tax=Meloidogyne graminicola TaxID=189291 RepID=A0A8S9ZIW7_9BILA|nr:Fanconi-associated nuclease [Meloidogyne graminicola]